LKTYTDMLARVTNTAQGDQWPLDWKTGNVRELDSCQRSVKENSSLLTSRLEIY